MLEVVRILIKLITSLVPSYCMLFSSSPDRYSYLLFSYLPHVVNISIELLPDRIVLSKLNLPNTEPNDDFLRAIFAM